jgi:hypothetical protein
METMNPVITFLINFSLPTAIAVISFVVAWKLSEYHSKIKETKERVDELPCKEHEAALDKVVVKLESISALAEKVDKLPCKEHEAAHHKVAINLEGISASIDFMRDSLNKLGENTGKKQTRKLSQTNSPMSLTERGIEVARELGMERMINRNWNSATELIRAEGKSNPYDIQQFIINSLIASPEKFLSPEDWDKIKRYAYKEGDPLLSYIDALTILVRDRYFKENSIDVDA